VAPALQLHHHHS
jgi:hypothetical protein